MRTGEAWRNSIIDHQMLEAPKFCLTIFEWKVVEEIAWLMVFWNLTYMRWFFFVLENQGSKAIDESGFFYELINILFV